MSSAGTPRGLFVTGTDTAVGKTIATGVLAVCLRAHGLNAGVMKPIETGIGVGVLPDSDWLLSVAPSADPRDMIAPYRLQAPAEGRCRIVRRQSAPEGHRELRT